VVVISTAVSFLIDYEGMGGSIVSSIEVSGVFSFQAPSFDFKVMGTLFVYAITISLIGFMEAISVAKSMATKTKQRLDVNQELIGQGLSNVVSSFFQGYAVSGSFSRSAVNSSAGAVTGFSSVVTAVIVGLTLLWLTPLLYHLPQATLAAIIVMAVLHLINFAPIRHAWKVEKHDGVVGALTFVLTLIFAPHLENGIAFGIIMSLGLFLYRTMQPKFSEFSARDGSKFFISVSDNDEDKTKDESVNAVKIVKFSGSLYFANAAYFENRMLELIAKNREQLKYIIVDVAGINQIDASGEEVLSSLVELSSISGIEILFARAEGIETVLRRSGFKEKFGEGRFFNRRVEALRFAWQEIEGESEEVEASTETL
jgi:SulP family sulfate permease